MLSKPIQGILGFEREDVFFESDDIFVTDVQDEIITIRVIRSRKNDQEEAVENMSFVTTISHRDFAEVHSKQDLSRLRPDAPLKRRSCRFHIPS